MQSKLNLESAYENFKDDNPESENDGNNTSF